MELCNKETEELLLVAKADYFLHSFYIILFSYILYFNKNLLEKNLHTLHPSWIYNPAARVKHYLPEQLWHSSVYAFFSIR